MSDSGTLHPRIQVRLLGSLAVSDGGRDLTSALAQPKRLALVALLALSRPWGLHRRDTVCALLWPESSDERARSALRQLLLVLRRELGEDAFVTRGDLVGLNRERVATDAGAVFDALEAGDDAAAVDRFTGELLPGLHLPESEAFEPWFEKCRRDLHQGVTRAAWRLVDRAEAGGDLAAARRAAERAMVVDPENEQGIRRLLSLQARSGDRAAALRTADRFARRLRHDWATDPELATLDLIERIRAGQLAASKPPGIATEPMAAAALGRPAPSDGSAAPGEALEALATDGFDSAEGSAGAAASPARSSGTAGLSAGASARRRSRPEVSASVAALVLLASALALRIWLGPAPKPVIRYGLAIPADRAMRVYNSPQFAFAPDASWLVYTGFASPGSAAETQLWVRPRDRLEATRLPETAGALTPSVSPDGQWIAFTANGQLRKVPARGGSATAMADSVEPGTVSVWLDDGTVAYRDVQRRLRRVPATGGVSEVVFTPRSEGQWAEPVAALPNGRGVLFLRYPGAALWVAEGGSGEARLLLPNVSWAAYAEGRLLFARRDGGVFAAPFDPGRLGMGGPPVLLFDGVRVDQMAQITLAASGTLAYQAGGRGLSEAVWVSRDGAAVPVDGAWAFQQSRGPGWAVSPDGTRLVISLNTGGNDDVWVKELDRGPLSRLTIGEDSDVRPRWVPDGRSVMFLRNGADLLQRRADGAGADSLVLRRGASPILEALWSPDRRWIVLRTGGAITGSREGGRDIQVLEVGRDTVPRPLLAGPYDEEVPALSPDGRWLAYVSTETGRAEVFVRPFPDVDAGKWQISTAGGGSPVWAHSGRELFFIRERGSPPIQEQHDHDLVSQAVLPGPGFQPGEQRVLFTIEASYELQAHNPSFDVSPDDQRFLMVRQKTGAADETQVLIVVENWLEEVRQAMKGGGRQ